MLTYEGLKEISQFYQIPSTFFYAAISNIKTEISLTLCRNYISISHFKSGIKSD